MSQSMNAIILQSPVEAALIIVHNIWTWVVVISTAVSLWMFESSPMLSEQESRGNDGTIVVDQVEMEATDKQASSILTSSIASSVTYLSDTSFASYEERTKGKRTVYFKQDVGKEYNDDVEERETCRGVELWFENWERLLKMRKGEMEWYCYQDMSVIDGNVVRLWDHRTLQKTPLLSLQPAS